MMDSTEGEIFLRQEVARLLKELKDIKEWRPIASAPIDGTPILAYVIGAEIPVVVWFEIFPKDIWPAPQGQWRHIEKERFKSDEEWEEDWRETRYSPDYWVPLLPLPKTK